ncbi:serine/threonine protein kinase [Pyxidicoccus trucidator]|uniref:serine/threonine protein kinase n=1 Tax=Pyxidicoccus trucidator TaxID=2709662 RepID=UPI0013DD5F90|nr:serine/threonine-protein kinase [Pyxidicoccus trucidator]
MRVGKYQLIRKLATGGMAEVFLAKAEGPGGFEKTLVLKRILPHLVEDPSFVEMFLGEARLVAGLNHPHIVQIFDFGEAEGSYFLAMEFIDGPNLRRWERQAASKGVKLPPAICARVVAAAAEGLAFAHDFRDPATGEPLGLIHRDVSPDNILVSRQGAVKVVDFGIAKVAGQKHRTQTGIVKGKVAYMPPEQVTAAPLDRRVDVYALGVVLYELLTGRLPFESASELGMMKAIVSDAPVPATRYRPDLPRVLQSILTTALAKDREGRYPDCRALQADLDRFVMSTGVPVGAYQIAQLVEQVVDGHAAPTAPTPATSPRRPEVEDGTEPTRAMGRGARRQGDGEEPPSSVSSVSTVKRPRSAKGFRKFVPAAVAGGVLLVAGGGYLLLGTSPGADLPRPLPATASETREAPGADSPTSPAVNGQGLSAAVGLAPAGGAAASADGAPRVGAAVATGAGTQPSGTVGGAAVATGAGTQLAGTAKTLADGEEMAPEGGLPTEGTAPASTAKAEGGSTTERKVVARREVKGDLGTLEFRIRPYAIVYLDGKKVGETPFAPIDVPEGIYAVTAVNPKLGKKVTRSIEVKAGEANVFKLNLLEE